MNDLVNTIVTLAILAAGAAHIWMVINYEAERPPSQGWDTTDPNPTTPPLYYEETDR